MKPIAKEDRRVANIHDAQFQTLLTDAGDPDGEALQVNGGRLGYGFHVYRMAPGETTEAHVHNGDEEFFLVDGDLADHDGYQYKPGDIIWLRSGTEHNSTTKNGCTLIVYFRDGEGS